MKKFGKKDGKPFAIVRLEDFTGSVEAMIWSAEFARYAKLLEPGKVVAVSGRVKSRNDELSVVVSEVSLLKPAAAPPSPVRLRLEMARLRVDELGELRDILAASPGESPVELEFLRADGSSLLMEVGHSHRVRLTPELEQRLASRLCTR